jgi:hypothetical protein
LTSRTRTPSFTLPDHTPVDHRTLQAVASRHGLDGTTTARDSDETVEARIVWRHLDLSLGMLPRGAVPGRSWAERPLPMLLEVLRFFLDPPNDRWRAIGPIELPLGTSSASPATSGGVAHV